MKKCTKCGEKKPLNEFHRRSSSPDGRAPQCKVCRIKAEAERQQRIAQQEKTTPKEKGCPNCGETKPASAFHKNRVRPDGLSCYCADCKSGVHRQWRNRISNQDKEIPDQKRCPTCDQVKSSDGFYRYDASPDGLDSRCKNCKDATINRWRDQNPEARNAQRAVEDAVKREIMPHISERDCEDCGTEAEHYHHPDYDRPLEVIPLCASCHRNRHLNLSPST